MIERQITPEEIAKLPCSRRIRFGKIGRWVLINGTVGVALKSTSILSIQCDKRTHIENQGENKPRKEGQPAEIGVMSSNIKRGKRILVGNELPLILEKTSHLEQVVTLKVSHTDPISIEDTDRNFNQMRKRLEADIVS